MNTLPAKTGGFELRLKAGLTGPAADYPLSLETGRKSAWGHESTSVKIHPSSGERGKSSYAAKGTKFQTLY